MRRFVGGFRPTYGSFADRVNIVDTPDGPLDPAPTACLAALWWQVAEIHQAVAIAHFNFAFGIGSSSGLQAHERAFWSACAGWAPSHVGVAEREMRHRILSCEPGSPSTWSA